MARETRTLAVVFADISDSSALYQKFGDTAAHGIVNACLALIGSTLARHDGRLVKTIGDEAMCVFPSADQAVLAASEMQTLVADSRPGDYPVSIHVGLHHGPVLVEGDDVFGDTVNIAAYLAAVATAEQILMTESTARFLSAPLKSCARPVFQTVLKGTGEEALVYQVLWRTDPGLTDVGPGPRKVIPGDTGSLLVVFKETRVRVDPQHSVIVAGRSPECDLVVTDSFASRKHFTIKLLRMHFYLFDHSINGTFVSLEGGEELHVLRRELLLSGAGQICLGHSRSERSAEVITFARDRRSLYRV